MKKIRKQTLSRIHGGPIKKFEINLTIGKRKYKNATPYAALKFLKWTDIDGNHKNLINEFKFFHSEYKKWKSKKLKNYSKAWQTRIKRKREEMEYFAYDFFRSISASKSARNTDHLELMGTAYFNDADSRWEHLWPWIVRNDFNGNEKEAMDAYTAWVKERWN